MEDPTKRPPVDDLVAAVRGASARGSDLDRLPRRLSPSRASDFKTCPQMFYYKTICSIREPATLATLKGTLAHTAFERIFDHPAGSRTPELAFSYVGPAWATLTDTNPDPERFPVGSTERRAAIEEAIAYRELAPTGSPDELALLAGVQAVVASWFEMERVNNFDPTSLPLPNGDLIDGREFHAMSEALGFTMHGFIDRVDRYVDSGGRAHWTISDYKTGKRPGEGKSYSTSTMARILDDKMFQLRVYAVLMNDMFGIEVELLRLLYVATGDRNEGIKTVRVTSSMIASTRAELRALWRAIEASARTGNWRRNVTKLCEWCYFHDICPAWAPQLQGIIAAELPAEASA